MAEWISTNAKSLSLLNLQIRHDRIRIMSKTNPVNAVGRFEFSCCYDGRLVIGGDDLVIDGAHYLIALYRHCDLLGNGLADTCGLIYGRVSDRWTAAHLERCGTKSADDKCSVTVRRAIEITLLVGSEIVTGDHDPVGMRMIVEAHVLRLGKRRTYGVIAFCDIRGVPIGHGRAGGYVKSFAILRQLGTVKREARGLFFGVDLTGPPVYQDAAGRNGLGIALLSRDLDKS